MPVGGRNLGEARRASFNRPAGAGRESAGSVDSATDVPLR